MNVPPLGAKMWKSVPAGKPETLVKHLFGVRLPEVFNRSEKGFLLGLGCNFLCILFSWLAARGDRCCVLGLSFLGF